jgi:hypothetical protein
MVASKVTLWLDETDQAVVKEEEGSVLIEIPGVEQCWDIWIDPSLFPVIRAAMDAAEAHG